MKIGSCIKQTGILLLICLVYINSCGMVTHSEVAYRAFENFTNEKYKKIILDHPSYFQAGPPFPDWGYTCKGYGEAAEYAHWLPFIFDYVEYINSKYEVGSRRYEQLVAFLLGVESHGIADLIWHWGPNTNGAEDQGFLNAMGHDASICKDDRWEKCHGIGDTGADFYLSYRADLHHFSDYWTYPINDLVEIYKISKLDVPKMPMIKCGMKMFLGYKLEWVVALVALNHFEKDAHFLTDDLDLFFSGGIDDMAVGTAFKWDKLIDVIEQKDKVSFEKIKEYEFIIKELQNEKNKNKLRTKDLVENILLDSKAFEYYQTLFGTNQKHEDGNMQVFLDDSVFNSNKEKIFELVSNSLFPETILDYARLIFLDDSSYSAKNNNEINSFSSEEPFSYTGKGSTFGDFDGDGNIDLALGAPGYGKGQQGAVYIIYNYRENKSNNDIFKNPVLVGENTFGRFGFSLTTVDINHDGIDDLVVSAPTLEKQLMMIYLKIILIIIMAKFMFITVKKQELSNIQRPMFKFLLNTKKKYSLT